MKWIRRAMPMVLCIALVLSQPVSAATLFTETESGITAAQSMALEIPSEFDDALPVAATASSLEIGGKSAILMDITSGTVLYEKNVHEKLPIASVTKIMTLLLVMEALDEGRISLDDAVTCSPEAASMGGSQIWLEPGEVMSVHGGGFRQ